MPALRVLVVAGELVPAARRIRVDADTVGALRDQVLEKMLGGGGGEAHAGVEVCLSGARGPVAIATMSQLRDKCKLELRRAAGGEPAGEDASAAAEDRRERMRSAFANMDVAAESPRTPRGGGGGGGGDDDDDGEEVPGTTFRRYLSADGTPYYHDTATGLTQWEPPAAAAAAAANAVAAPRIDEEPGSEASALGVPESDLAVGQAVCVKGHEEVWDVVRTDVAGGLIQVRLRGEAIKKTYPAHQLVLASSEPPSRAEESDDPEPADRASATDAAGAGPGAAVYAGGTQKLRVVVGDHAAGFVMVLPSATLVEIRAEIVDDELEVPEPFSFVADDDVVKPTQEKKLRAAHFLASGHVQIVADGDGGAAGSARGTQGGGRLAEGAAAGAARTPESDGQLPVLVGHLSKCVRASAPPISQAQLSTRDRVCAGADAVLGLATAVLPPQQRHALVLRRPRRQGSERLDGHRRGVHGGKCRGQVQEEILLRGLRVGSAAGALRRVRRGLRAVEGAHQLDRGYDQNSRRAARHQARAFGKARHRISAQVETEVGGPQPDHPQRVRGARRCCAAETPFGRV